MCMHAEVSDYSGQHIVLVFLEEAQWPEVLTASCQMRLVETRVH